MAKRKRRYEYHSPETEARAKRNLPQYRTKTIEEIRKEAEKFQSQKKKLKDLSIIEFAENPNYLGLSFKRRKPQKVILKCLYGMELDQEEQRIFNTLTKGKGRYTPGHPVSEAVLALGARSGKSTIISTCALYEGIVGYMKNNLQKYIAKDENIYIVIISTRELQSRMVIQNACLRMLRNSPVLQKWIDKSIDLEITLKNGVKIISSPCSSTSLRGVAIQTLILDECAFFRLEGPKQDEVIFNSLRPRMAQFINGKLFLASTAGSRQGLFWNFFNDGFNVEDRLTVTGKTNFINEMIPQKFLDKERNRDVDSYMREYECVFSERMEGFFSYEMLSKPFSLAGDVKYESNRNYCLALDQSGLSGRDFFGLAVSSEKKDMVRVDLVRSWNTRNLDEILQNIEEIAKEYHISKAIIDRYSKGYIEALFRKIGLEVMVRPALSDVYVATKSLILQDRLAMPDRTDLKNGFRNSIAVYGKSNQLTITHSRDSFGHADEADAVCGSVWGTSQKLGGSGIRVRWLDDGDEEDESEGWQTIGGSNESNLLPEKYNQL